MPRKIEGGSYAQENPLIRDQFADKWCGKRCTLNGRPAKIAGRRMRFALVLPIDPLVMWEEFSWETVDAVMSKGGRFTS